MNYGHVTVRRIPPAPRPTYEIVAGDKLASFSLDIIVNGRTSAPGVLVEGDTITIAADNGSLVYRVVCWDALGRGLVGELVASTVEGIEP